jgi:hypothetical protein
VDNPIQKRWLKQPGGIVERLLQLQGSERNVSFAMRAGILPSKFTKLRKAQQMPTPEDIHAWVSAAGASEEVEQELLEILDFGTKTGFARSLQHGQAAHQHTYNELVEQAKVISMLERSFIPSVLQTQDYASAVLTASMKLHKAADDVTAAVAARMERKQYLFDGKHEFHFVLDETVLTRTIGSAAVMHTQLAQLLEYMDRSNIELGILPIYGEYHDVVRNSFELYGEIGVIETYYDDAEMDLEAWVAHMEAMAEIWQDAVEGDEARQLIRNAMDHHARGMNKRRGR